MSSRLLIIALLGLALAIGILWYTRTDSIRPLPSTPIDATAAAPPDPSPPRSRVRRVSRAEREQLREQIARARSASRSAASGSAPQLPDARRPEPAHESKDPAVRKFNERALEELGGAQTYLGECFDRHRAQLPPRLTVFTRVVITTDPDIGAIVDAEALTDPDGKPLPAELDSCIRDMLQTFTLPPLPPTDDSQFLLALQLSFRDDDEADRLEP